MPPKTKSPQNKKGKKQTPSPKTIPVKRKRKIRKSKQSPSVTQEENEEIDNYLREMLPSIVLAEDPCHVKQTTLPVRMDICEFWQFLFSDHWEGRVRVCEGFLMTKLQETFEHLVKTREITKTQVVRDFDVPLSSFFKPNAEAAETALRRRLGSNQVVKITFTYYGENYRKLPKQVRFHKHPNSVFTPRLRTLHSILKNPSDENKNSEDCYPYEEEQRVTGDKHDESSLRSEVESDSQPIRRDFDPALRLSTNSSERPLRTNEDNYFKSKVPDNIEHQCVRAMKEFVVVKEHVIKSKIWMTRTEITFARKESRWQMFQTSAAMNAFYSSPLFLSSLSIIPYGKAGLDLTVV